MFTCASKNDIKATGMLIQERSHIIDIVVNEQPAIFFFVVAYQVGQLVYLFLYTDSST